MNTDATPSCAGEAPPSVAERLRGIRVGVRSDLEVTRHVFRGEPSYAIRDPLTMQSHRLAPDDYEVLVAINARCSLGDVFADLCGAGRLTPQDEERFYQFVLSLHRLNLLSLPISDEKVLYQRHRQREAARRREKLFGFLYLRVPLWNPDTFLAATMRKAGWLFHKWSFLAWCGLMVAAAIVGYANWPGLVEPAQGLLAARNLPLTWITLVVLKAIHEFGHAYACKRYGGEVPEMGAVFILFTPCAYVDATSCWKFSRRRDRLVVCLAGMYVESVAAALALFAWSATEAGLLHDLAYRVIFLAGVMTVVFNINPLMRYDGYYALSDWLEVPNLRQRSVQYVVRLLKHYVVGVPQPGTESLRLRAILLGFGVAATVYRTTVLVAICAVVAMKFFLVGLGAGLFLIGSTVFGMMRRMLRYLWYAQETAAVRVRAVAVSVVVLLGAPVILLAIPARRTLQAAGVAGFTEETLVRAGVDGVLTEAWVQPGQLVEAGAVLVVLQNDACAEALLDATARLAAAEIRVQAYEARDPSRAQGEREQAEARRVEVGHRSAEARDLQVRTPVGGAFVGGLRATDLGRFVRRGEPVGLVVAGGAQVRVLLTADEFADAAPAVGQTVQVRTSADPAVVVNGVIANVAAAGKRQVEHAALTHLVGGDIVVDASTGQSREAYFEITVVLTMSGGVAGGIPSTPDSVVLQRMGFRCGGTCQVRFRAAAEPIGTVLLRRMIRFADTLRQA